MKILTTSAAILLTIATIGSSQAPKGTPGQTKRYLYISTPDAAQDIYKAGLPGILVFDIDDGHKFVRRIPVPEFKEGLRGFTPNLKTHSAFFSLTSRRVGSFDLESEKMIWDKVFEAGADRSAVTPDGKKIYMPTGYWYLGEDGGMIVANAANGDVIKRVKVGPAAHNSLVSLDGRLLFLGSQTTFTVYDTKDERVIRQFKDVGERAIFPFTVDSRNHYAYVCLGNNVGFDMLDLESGKVITRIYAGKEKIPHRTHGAALTPDETELWITDQLGQTLFVYDATKVPPTPKAEVTGLSIKGHGWVTFSLDGKYAYTHTPEVFDAKTRKIVATLKDENGLPVSGSKYFEVHMRDGKVVEMGSEFGMGRKK
jgi:DNA-binding beta-propeller fold protein YncE